MKQKGIGKFFHCQYHYYQINKLSQQKLPLFEACKSLIIQIIKKIQNLR